MRKKIDTIKNMIYRYRQRHLACAATRNVQRFSVRSGSPDKAVSLFLYKAVTIARRN